MFLGKLKIVINYLRLYGKNFSLGRKLNLDGKKVYLNLNDRRLGPYYYALIFFFHENGYNIWLKNNIGFIGGCLQAEAHIFELPRLKIGHGWPRVLQASEFLYLTDKKAKQNHTHKWLKEVVVECDVYGKRHEEKEKNFLMPFPMSPVQYINGSYKRIDIFRKMERKIKIFFSGNQDKDAYTHPVISQFFKKMNRIEVIEALIANLSVEEKLSVTCPEQLEDLYDTYQNKFVLSCWQWSASNSSKLELRIKNESWLETIAKSHFFLAPPGIRMPLCFNIVEAMAVGTIPITEYPEFFNPPLEHMKNCIVYNNKADLVEKVRMVLSMEDCLINFLKDNVASYYDAFLSPTSFKKILDKLEHKNTLLLNAEEASYQDYLQNKHTY